MSKQESNQTKRNLLRRGLAGILLLAMLFGLLPSTVFTARAASWADPYCQTLVDWGVMRGDINGNLAPDRSITRAEFVTMMNRAYGYTKLGGNPFTDVRITDWYYEDIDIGYNIGYFKGTAPTKASPNDTLTREQAAVLLARNMMLQETVGETLGFSDSRTLSEWSRGLVGAAAASGIISGYDDGSFQPFKNITRGEVAAMLVRAIGTPINTEGEHALGNVYGNVTVNTSGVKLRDGVIVGNLYLTGGIDLGEVLLENVTVLGEIIVSGGGESNSSASSIIMRNVVADGMIVDSISDQFVTIRAEGNTDIPTTTVRTNAYVDDSSLPGYGLSHITLDGGEGALLQLAGNIKDVVNKTPGSDLQVVQGVADKITVDENATGSSVLVDGDARVDDLNLDTATTVTGTGDIGNLNVGAAGSTVEQLPDNITIRPGITTDINGSTMNSTQAAESSSDPKLLAGYPAVKQIAPTSATLVFKTNKTGTVYWAVSAVADGSVKEEDLLEPPVYGGNILKSGSVSVTEANKEITAAVTGLTRDGSYYVTAMLVDGRGEHSPIKVTSFTTPDDTVPAFASGYPYMSKITCDEAQVTVMTTKSCLLYYALLPDGAAQPTPAEFKAAAIPGSLGYGSLSVTKNVTMPFPVNREKLDEKTNYVLYLWLTDHDGAKSSAVTALRFTTPDETPPVVTDIYQSGETATSIRVNYTIDEPADLVWVLVTEGDHMAQRFLPWTKENFDPNNEEKSTLEFADEAALQAAKVWMVGGGSGATVVASGSGRTNPLNINNIRNTTASSFVLYYIANDRATTTGNLSTQIKALRVHTTDEIKPTAELLFTNKDQSQVKEEPDADADVSIIFSENVKGGTVKGQNIFLNLYKAVERAEDDLAQNLGSSEYEQALASAKSTLGQTLANYIVLYRGTSPTGTAVTVRDGKPENEANWVIDWRNAKVKMLEDGSGKVEVLLPTVKGADEKPTADSALNLDSGASYYFRLSGITDLATTNNPLDPTPCFLPFTTSFAKIEVTETEAWGITLPGVTDNSPNRIITFLAEPTTVEKVGDEIYWDMLIWSNTTINFTLYSREISANGTPGAWKDEGTTGFTVSPNDGFIYRSLKQMINTYTGTPDYEQLNLLGDREYAIYINSLEGNSQANSWNYPDLQVRVSFVAGTRTRLSTPNVGSGSQGTYEAALANGVSSIEVPSPCIIKKPIQVLSAPEIQEGFPTITVTDTSATINLSLDKDGSVYYLLLPMTQMSQSGVSLDNALKILTEAEVAEITSFSMYYTPYEVNVTAQLLPKDVTRVLSSGTDTKKGVKVSTPNVDDVTRANETLGNQFPNGVMPRTGTARARTQITIPLTDVLSPNTVYYMFLVTRSDTAIYSDNPVCYRFTTSEPIRPTIQASGSGTTVNVTVDKTTNLTYFLARNGFEGEMLLRAFSGYANNDWVGSTGTGTGWNINSSTGICNFTKDGVTYAFAYNRNNGDLTKMTVVDAMATPCYNGTINNEAGYLGSVFDVFASSESKTVYYTAITGSAIGDGVAVAGGSQSCNAKPANNPISFSGLSSGYYTFISAGVAPQGQGSGPAFRAYYSIRVEDTKHPQVVATSQNTTADTTGNLKGTIGITFDGPLHYVDTSDSTRREVEAVDSCKSHGGKAVDKTWALGDILYANSSAGTVEVTGLSGTTSHVAGSKKGPQIINASFENLREGDEITFLFNTGLCNSTGQGQSNQLRVVFRMTAELTNPGGTGIDKYTYRAELKSINTAQWDGVTG